MSVVGQLYRCVIDDVIKNVKAEVAAEGLDDSVLQELQQTWELKLQQSGAVNLTVGDDYAHPAYTYDLNSYATTSFIPSHTFPELTHNPLYSMSNQAYMNNAPTELSAAPRPLPSNSTQVAANALRTLNNNTNTLYDTKPAQYMGGWNVPNVPVNVNLTDTRSGSSSSAGSIQNILRQNDGASDEAQSEQAEEIRRVDAIVQQKYEEILKKKAAKKEKKEKRISQLDGNSDDEDSEQLGASDEELGSDDDENDDDDAEPETENFILCQYEKVARIKNKRKTNLKDGIMHLNGRDTVFHKATGEFEW